MTSRLIRLTLSAIAMAQTAAAQSVAKPPLATQTQQREVETGSWRAGDAIVWVRVAPTGAIAVFASHGYRSAFAHAVYITPEDADRWADIGDHVIANQPPAPVILADSDLSLEPTKQGDSAVLTVRLGGVRPDGITFFLTPTALREVSPLLRQSAKTARANQAASAGPSAAATPPAATPVAPAAAIAPVAAPAPTPAVPNTASAVIVAPPEVAAPGTAAASAPTVAEAPTEAPAVSAPASVVKVAQVTKTTAPVTDTKPATPVVASVAMRRTSAGIIAKPATTAPTRDDVADATRLSPSTVANLVKQWQSQLDLCYSEYGLKVNPALTGSIAVRLAIRSSGEVAAATFTRHNWSGAGGTEAESCMRARVMTWMFPPASTPSAHEFTVAFAP